MTKSFFLLPQLIPGKFFACSNNRQTSTRENNMALTQLNLSFPKMFVLITAVDASLRVRLEKMTYF